MGVWDEPASAVGADRNLRNLTVGDEEKVTFYNMSRVVEIGQITRSVVKSFKRNDVRVRQRIASKYGKRRSERVKQIMHRVTKRLVSNAKANRQAIVFEEAGVFVSSTRKGTVRVGHSEER